jgi:hypothetical protein
VLQYGLTQGLDAKIAHCVPVYCKSTGGEPDYCHFTREQIMSPAPDMDAIAAAAIADHRLIHADPATAPCSATAECIRLS